jgi:hypothetical protein
MRRPAGARRNRWFSALPMRKKAGMLADDFMKPAQPLLDAPSPGGVPLKLITETASPMHARMGIKTGKKTRNG